MESQQARIGACSSLRLCCGRTAHLREAKLQSVTSTSLYRLEPRNDITRAYWRPATMESPAVNGLFRRLATHRFCQQSKHLQPAIHHQQWRQNSTARPTAPKQKQTPQAPPPPRERARKDIKTRARDPLPYYKSRDLQRQFLRL